MRVSVVVLEVFLVDVAVRVHAVAVIVLVDVLDVVVSMLGARMVVGDAAVVVSMAVAVLVVAGLGGVYAAGLLSRGRIVRGAAGTEADDREVAEARLVAKGLLDRGADRVKARGGHAVDAVTALADEVLAFGVVLEGVEAGAVADVDVSHHAELLEVLEVAIHRADVRGRQLSAKTGGDELGRDGAVGGEQRRQHDPAR
jgi:hypothetical protein